MGTCCCPVICATDPPLLSSSLKRPHLALKQLPCRHASSKTFLNISPFSLVILSFYHPSLSRLMGQNTSSLLCRIPPEALNDIVVLAVDDVGPPKQLLTCLSICREITSRLDVDAVSSRIFRCNFDTSAPERRFAEDAMYPRHLSAQLKAYCSTLRIVKSGDVFAPDLQSHLWNAFFMLTENDGKNARQLEWADVHQFVDRFIRRRLHEHKEENDGWPLETAVNSLALCVLYLCQRHGT